MAMGSVLWVVDVHLVVPGATPNPADHQWYCRVSPDYSGAQQLAIVTYWFNYQYQAIIAQAGVTCTGGNIHALTTGEKNTLRTAGFQISD